MSFIWRLLNIAWEAAVSQAQSTLTRTLEVEMESKFQAAEWEQPIQIALQGIYPGTEIRWTAGPGEQGADVVVQIPNHFTGTPWLIVIQIKNYKREIGEEVLSQIRQAYEHYGREGNILMGVIMTTATSISTGLHEKRKELETELHMPIKVILKKQLIKLLGEGLSKKFIH